MNLVKRTPDNWFPSVLDDMFKPDWLGGISHENRIGMRIPAVNIQDNEDNFILEVAAPGKSREDFKLELDDDVLSISSEEKKENETAEKRGNFTRREFSYSTFKRAFTLPESVDSEKIDATYKDGVLEINLPKREEAKVQPKRMIEIS